MRVLWTHNFDPSVLSGGVFMNLLADGLREQGVEIDLHFLGNVRSIKGILKAREQLREVAVGYDVVHAQFGSACSLVTTAVKDRPVVISLRGSDWYIYRERFNKECIHGMLAHFMSRASLRKANHVITMSDCMTESVIRAFPGLSVSTVTDPVDLSQFKPIEKKEARAELGFENDDRKWVLFTTLSKTNPIKRVGLAEEAVKRVNEKLGGVTIKYATGLKHEEMPCFVSACDVILCTSVHEGWPNSIKEALACNVPFVATEVSDLKKIADQEPSCRICSSNSSDIAESIVEVLDEERVDLTRHVSQMDVPVVSKQVKALYEKLLA